MVKVIPGKTNNHQYSSIETAPSLISKPHELRGGWTPNPRKLKKDQEHPGKKVYNTTGYFTGKNIPFLL